MASWVISDEKFFPRGGVSGLPCASAARTESPGLLPGSTDQLNDPAACLSGVSGGVEVPGVTIGQLGNPTLRPERVTEVEAGFACRLDEG
jgi:outer membrane receptor protein involved in Fe transport